jgi:hypothetical protein
MHPCNLNCPFHVSPTEGAARAFFYCEVSQRRRSVAKGGDYNGCLVTTAAEGER